MPPLTPLDIQHKEFTKAMRGYAMHEVDTFLDQVTEEFTRMQDEIARLREQASSAGPPQQAPVQLQAPPPPPPPQPQPVAAEARGGGAGGEEAIARALVMAQRMADQTVEEAKVKAKSMVAEAEARAKNMTEQARMQIAQATEQVARRRQELESSIEALRAFERDYRARLRGFVEGQLKALEDAAPSGPVAPPQPPGLGGNSRPLPGADDLPALSTGARQNSYSTLRDTTSDQLGHNGRDRVDRLRHDD